LTAKDETMHDTLPHIGQWRPRRAGRWATVLIAVGLLTVACGGSPPKPGVANIGPSQSASPSAAPKDAKAAGLAYSRCMRSHGLKNFPDPDSNGGITINGKPGDGLDPNSPTMKAAQQACKSLRPEPTAQEKSQMRANGLKYAKCMRANGLKDFPDPSADGGIQIQMKPGSDLDPKSPKFQAADKACKKFQPAAPGGDKGGNNVEGGS
jgi:hypothetical protein